MIEKTFGLEMEFVDVEKNRVHLPFGYSWSKDEKVHNTDMTVGSFSYHFGGEINTPPLHLSHKVKDELSNLFDEIFSNNGKITREVSLQVHIDISKCSLDEVKNIFYLSYYTSKFIKEVAHVPSYSDFGIFSPSPNLSFYEGVKKSEDFNALRSVFVNSSNKGFFRHIVNIASYFKRGTVEMRMFNATSSIDLVFNCVMFSYRFVQYAITHNEDDFKNIISVDDFVSKLKIKNDYPKLLPPLLFYGDPLDISESLKAKHIPLSQKMVKVLEDNTPDDLAIVNPHFFILEMQIIANKRLKIYNTDEFNHIVYLLAKNELKIEYSGKALFLEQYNSDSPISQLACLFFLMKVKNLFSNTDYAITLLDAYKQKGEQTIQKFSLIAEKMINLFKNSEYHVGTLNDAIKENKSVFFQFDDYSKEHSAVAILKKCSNYSLSFTREKTQYYDLIENIGDTQLSLVSSNRYLNLNKISVFSSGKVFYSTKENDCIIQSVIGKEDVGSCVVPPDDLIIDDVDKLKIVSVTPTIFSKYQKVFIKKVEKTSKATYCFLVVYDSYVLGGFGFAWSKMPDYDLWLLSDFSTNNKIYRLSKLILLCLLSYPVKKKLSRMMFGEISHIYTKVYTKSPVSMKYRGLFKKESKNEWGLLYSTELGKMNSYDEIINKYKSYQK